MLFGPVCQSETRALSRIDFLLNDVFTQLSAYAQTQWVQKPAVNQRAVIIVVTAQ